MAVFTYKAIDSLEVAVSGTLVADSPRQARDSLRARGLAVHDLLEAHTKQRRRRLFWRAGQKYQTKVVLFTRELSTLLGIGVPILEAIDSIARQHHGPFGSNLMLLRDRISAGVGLADAMAEQQEIFDDLTTQMVDVGESSGTLDSVLDKLADFKERSAAMKSRVATALVYPTIVLCMGISISIFLMTFVVPNLLTMLIDAGKPLPFATQIVKGISDFLLYRWWMLLSGAAAIVTSTTVIVRTEWGRRRWHRMQLRIPLFGELVRKQELVRMTIVLSTLLKSGIVFVRALQIAQRSTRNLFLKNALFQCEAAVGGGRDIAEALEATGAFPPLVIQVFSVGQHSGQLEEMLERLARDYDRQINSAVARLNAVLEPFMIILLAVIVGFIAFATIMPILEASDVF